MNKAITATLAGLAMVASVSAQGVITLNSATGTKPRITLDGVNASAADNVFVQVLVAGASSLTGAGAEPFALTLTGGNAGLFNKSILTVGGKAGGATVDMTIRAWDKDSGASYDDATIKATTTFSAVLGGAGDPPGPPTGIVPGFSGLALVTPVIPEPSTYALAALGLGGLLFLRRK